MKQIKLSLSVLALTLASTLVFAEPTAPVYDVDSMSSDSQSESGVTQQDNSKAALNQVLTTSSEPPATVEQRVERIEQQLANAQQNDPANRLNSLQGEVQALRGQVEELTHQLQELHNQQQTQHAEVDKGQNKEMTEQAMSPLPREGDEDGPSTTSKTSSPKSAAKLATAAPLMEGRTGKQSLSSTDRRFPVAKVALTKKLPTPPSVAEQPNVAEEQAVYQTAYNLIKVKKYNEAIGSLQKMLAKYPSGQFAANAHYWLGELYSLTGENEQAASEFNIVVKQYPSNPRVADAELKLGLINATLLKWPAAKASFKKVISKYPGSTSARLAMEQLKLLKQTGH